MTDRGSTEWCDPFYLATDNITLSHRNLIVTKHTRIAPAIVGPHAAFRGLTEADIEKALADSDPANPVAVEVARLLQGYISNFQALVERLGHVPTDILHMTPRWPIEAVAMRLNTDTIKEAMRGH